MQSTSKANTDMSLRKLLEYCYDHGKLDEAIIIGDLLDRKQSLLIQKNHHKVLHTQLTLAVPA